MFTPVGSLLRFFGFWVSCLLSCQGRCLGDTEARIILCTPCSANAESTPTDRIAQARLAQIHSERAEINRFAVGEAH